MTQTTEQLCQHHILENNIHEFVILDYSHKGADAFVTEFMKMIAQNKQDQVSLVLADSSRGSLPLKYVFDRMRTIYTTLPKSARKSRVALIHRPDIILGLVGGLVRGFPQSNLQIFKPDEREAALRWLRQ